MASTLQSRYGLRDNARGPPDHYKSRHSTHEQRAGRTDNPGRSHAKQLRWQILLHSHAAKQDADICRDQQDCRLLRR